MQFINQQSLRVSHDRPVNKGTIMRALKAIIPIVALASLAACATPWTPERDARARRIAATNSTINLCTEALDLSPNHPAFGIIADEVNRRGEHCGTYHGLIAARQAAEAQRSAAIMGVGAGMMARPAPAPFPTFRPSINCQSTRVGFQVNTTCY